jgi:hypothetical protein
LWENNFSIKFSIPWKNGCLRWPNLNRIDSILFWSKDIQ